MEPISDEYRSRLRIISAMLCVIPMFLAPLAGESSIELASERATFTSRFHPPAIPLQWHTQPLAIARDPFVPAAGARPGRTLSPRSRDGADAGMEPGFGVPVVQAVVSGSSPRALVEQDGTVRVIAPGDIFAGSPVVRIDRTGVRLQSGITIALRGGGR